MSGRRMGSRRAEVVTVTADGAGFGMLAGLLEAGHLATLEQLHALTTRHAAAVGLSDVTILIPDLRQELLIPLTATGQAGDALSVDAGLPGRAFRHVELIRSDRRPAGHHFWVPLLDGTERVGVLGATAAG